jgi:TonB family protein
LGIRVIGTGNPTNEENFMTKKMLALIALTFLAQGSLAGAQEATVSGTLDKDLIRRVIQRHIGEVKQCYQAQLPQHKSLAGRVMARFTVGTDGKVLDSRIAESTLKSPACEDCIAAAVRTWEFPKPRGGKVVVNYPFVLASSDPGESSDASKK